MLYKLNIGRYQFSLTLNRKRGRPSQAFLNRFENIIRSLVKLATDKRSRGSRISRVIRRAFETKKIKKILGFNLATMVLVTSLASGPMTAFTHNQEADITPVTTEEVELTTEDSVRIPLDNFEITQSYRFFHRGLDLKGKKGAPIYPIMAGVVETVSYQRFGYGNHVIINHGSSFKSLYAHLSKINVEKNQEVDQDTIIGLVGSTGFSTGTHLHLEIWEDSRPINPLTILK